MKPKLLLFLCFAIGMSLTARFAKAQSSDAQYFVPEPFPKSPNVASFAKYGDYDVSEYTGVPNISIPLYTIEAGSIKIPLTLSYHASGNKVTDAASWVGLSWSLAGGGAISRRVMGGPDDGAYGYLKGYLKQQATLDMLVDSDMLYVDNLANGTYDGRPDIYSYDLPGHSGKFFFDGTNAFRPVLLPMAPINIKYKLDSAIVNFNITDENGNIYKFGDADIETTQTSGAGKTGSPVITSWLPETMISQNRRDTVTFSYGSDYVFQPDATSQMQVLTDNIQTILPGGTNPYTANIGVPTATGISTGVAELPLQQINFRNGKVVFELEDSLRKDINVGVGNNVHALKDIKVYAYNYATKQMEVQKTIILYKSYFGTTATNNLRLRLDSIQILDKAGSIIQHYRFRYNSITLPAYGSFARDYWGYYNGKTTSTSLIPQMTVPYNGGTTTIGGTVAHNRDCDSNYMQAEVLDTIYYPTGGYSTFTYQSNQYTSSGSLKVAGGLRVTSISSYDNINSAPMVKTYIYNTADSNYFFSYSFYAAPTQTHRYYILGGSGSPREAYACDVHNYISNPNIDLEPFDAAPVVYPSVTVYNGTAASNSGKTDYYYSFESDNLQDATITGTPVVTTHFYVRGLLDAKIESIRLSGGTYQTVKKDTNSYSAFAQTEYGGVGIICWKMFTNEGVVSPNEPLYQDAAPLPTDLYSYLYDNYFINSQDNYLTSTKTYIYDTTNPTNYTTSTVNYTYDDTTHQQIAKTSHVDSKGNTHVTVNQYPYDYLSGGTTHNAVLDTMISRHMYAEVVEKWDSVKDVAASSNFISGAQLNQYKYGSYTGSIVPSTISTLSVSSPITNFTPASVVSGVLTGDSRYVQMISFDAYDAKNNITHYTPRNATPTAIMWDYLYDFPVAQVKNAPATGSQAYTGFEADSRGGWTYSGTPVADLTAPTGKLVYPLSSGNITNTSYYNTKANILSYWSNGAAATVTAGGTGVTGTAMTTVNGWTYYEHTIPASGGSITISGTMSIDELRLYPVDAQMITYIYSPDGLTSIADTKGSVSHFEYDYFQRLKNIKDFFGNIVNNYGYHTYDQTIGNDAMNAVFTRNNCPPNTTPGSLTYWVPVNKYYSSTKASANAEATYDLNTNGQAKANQNCGCPAVAAFTLTNNTGINGFQVTFSGIGTPYNFPTTGSTIIYVPVGTYATVTAGPFGSYVKTFVLGARTPITGHSATFSSVLIATSGSTDTSLTINN